MFASILVLWTFLSGQKEHMWMRIGGYLSWSQGKPGQSNKVKVNLGSDT